MISILPVEGLPEVREGDDLGALIAGAARLEDGDVVVVAQKAVSKSEGRVVRLDEIEPGPDALRLAGGRDPRLTQAILDEADAGDLDGLGQVRAIVTRTLMSDADARRRLAEAVLGAVPA